MWIILKSLLKFNKKAVEADFFNRNREYFTTFWCWFSGGAKIVEPGICGYSTTAATHISAALLDEIPLGDVNNPCREGIEKSYIKDRIRFF